MPKSHRSGRKNKLTGQIGEYLVAAELARQGLIATTFTGNVPHYDIVASDAEGRHVSVQVKTSNSSSWQFGIDKFCKITFRGDRQVVGSPIPPPVRRLVVVFVRLGADRSADRFFVCTWVRLRGILVRGHSNWLKRHGGRRPQNPKSLHTGLDAASLDRFEDSWATVRRYLR
jgi:hypothetical protein